MNRIEFANSLECSDHIISNYDNFMVCYDIINYYDMIQVNNYSIIDANKILFNISIPSDVSVNKIKRILDRTIINKYNSIYQIQSNIIDNDKLNIILYKTGVSG